MDSVPATPRGRNEGGMPSSMGTEPRRDTIFAPSTGSGPSAVSVVRISGPQCEAALSAIAPGRPLVDRVLSLRRLRDKNDELLDRALVVRFYAPRTFTGEEMAELHVTGGRAVMSGVLEMLGAQPGLRPAEPGEFAWRAFQNGKLDLSAVEGLGELVLADTAAQRRQAMRVAEGQLSQSAEAIRTTILRAMALVEAELDFSDAEEASGDSRLAVHEVVGVALRQVRTMLVTSSVAERLRDGLTVVIAGAPNSGKSTLMNVLSKREVAIVSEIPGTTRDLLEVFLDLEGYPVRVVDTAGIRESTDPIEQMGVERAQKALAQADVVLWLYQEDRPFPPDPAGGGEIVLVRSKSDLGRADSEDDSSRLAISAKSGAGIEMLLARLADVARSHFRAVDTNLLITERQRRAFVDAEEALGRILAEHQTEIELLAEDLRIASRAMGRISGRVDVEDVLGDIFSRLCIGK